MQEFFRGLGYMGLGESSINALGIAPAFGVLGGLGELSRLNRLITPEFGPMVRVFIMITDLPVATDKPIDAGIMKFLIILLGTVAERIVHAAEEPIQHRGCGSARFDPLMDPGFILLRKGTDGKANTAIRARICPLVRSAFD